MMDLSKVQNDHLRIDFTSAIRYKNRKQSNRGRRKRHTDPQDLIENITLQPITLI